MRCHLQELETGLLTKGLPGAGMSPVHGPPLLLDTIATVARSLGGRRIKCGRRATPRSPGVRGPPLPAQHPPRAQPRGGGSSAQTEAFPEGERSPSPPGLPQLRADRYLPALGEPGARTLGRSGPRAATLGGWAVPHSTYPSRRGGRWAGES